jgi:ribosomal protein L11 methyltransferase
MMDEEDWSEAWKKHFVVHRPARHVVIKPSWLEYPPQPGEVVVELDPGAAFGTGLHPTTMLCLEALEDIVRPGMRVYDVGTGSGILAIAAARLGAARVVAVDTDPVAVRVARENVERNGLGGRVEVAEGSATPEVSGGFDLVLANIVANTIVQLAPSLRAALRPGGALVVSGIIRGRTPEVRAALRAAGLRNIVSRRSGDWLALRAERDGPA